jgi:hypothetical protein
MDFAVGGTEPHRVRIDAKLVCLIGATTVQTCIVHLIRQSPKYVPHRQYEQVVKDRQRPAADLHSDQRRRCDACPRGVRGEVGAAAAQLDGRPRRARAADRLEPCGSVMLRQLLKG